MNWDAGHSDLVQNRLCGLDGGARLYFYTTRPVQCASRTDVARFFKSYPECTPGGLAAEQLASPSIP